MCLLKYYFKPIAHIVQSEFILFLKFLVSKRTVFLFRQWLGESISWSLFFCLPRVTLKNNL